MSSLLFFKYEKILLGVFLPNGFEKFFLSGKDFSEFKLIYYKQSSSIYLFGFKLEKRIEITMNGLLFYAFQTDKEFSYDANFPFYALHDDRISVEMVKNKLCFYAAEANANNLHFDLVGKISNFNKVEIKDEIFRST